MNIEIANRLVGLRKKRGLSQEELAGRLGISRQAVSKWERAEASPDTDNLILLARLYGVSLDELLRTDAPDEAVREAAGSPEWKPTEDDVVRMVREAWRQQGGEPEVEPPPPQTESPFFAEPPRAPEPPRDAFSGEASEWEASPGDTDAELRKEWPDGAAPVDRRQSRKKLIHTLRGIYPILCLFVYLFLGFFLHAWHPSWIIFLTTPIFYRLTAHLE